MANHRVKATVTVVVPGYRPVNLLVLENDTITSDINSSDERQLPLDVRDWLVVPTSILAERIINRLKGKPDD